MSAVQIDNEDIDQEEFAEFQQNASEIIRLTKVRDSIHSNIRVLHKKLKEATLLMPYIENEIK